MDTNERRDDMIPLGDQGQQINLVVTPPTENGMIEIDLRRVFHNMKTRRRIYAWVMILCLVIGVCAPLLLYQFGKHPLTVSSVVTLKYDVVQKDDAGKVVSSTPVQDLTAPDGTELDLGQLTSSYVLQAALDGLTLSQPLTLADLRSNVRVDRILTEDSRRQQEVASQMMEDNNGAVYDQVKNIDLTYTNDLVVSLTNGFGKKEYELTDGELRLVLDRILSAYNEYLVDTYADAKLPDDRFSVIDIRTLDIQESLDLLRTAVADLYDFCDDKPDGIKAYRSWRTGKSLRDLMAELETVRTVSVEYLYSYVYTNNIVRDRSAMITNYRYQLRNAQTQMDAILENIATNQDILNTYKNDEIFVSMQESDTAKSTKTTTDYYNGLIIEQAENYDRVAELEVTIADLEDKLARLNDADASAAYDAEKVEQELSSVLDICKKAYAQVCELYEEIIESSFFATYAEHTVAQGKQANFLSANAKKMAIGGFAGVFIACAAWFCSGIAPEFKLKKDEDTEGKGAAK